MPDVNRWVRDFEESRHLYEELGEVAKHDLTQVLHDRGLTTQLHHGGVSFRVKDVESFREKISRKKYEDPLEQTPDLLGVRIVCLYPSVFTEIDKVIRDTFTVVHYEDKGRESAPDLWRYSSIHYDCQLPEDCSGPRYDRLKNLIFEIQVRTILQDAWATIEHRLGYKNEKEIPDELKREFSALAGLLHVADQRFQFIADRMQERSKELAEKLSPLYLLAIEGASSGNARDDQAFGLEAKMKELESRPDAIIDRGSLKALLRGMYTDRSRARNYDYSVFIQDLAAADIVNLGTLGRLLIKGDSAAREKGNRHDTLSDLDFARAAVAAANPAIVITRRQRRQR